MLQCRSDHTPTDANSPEQRARAGRCKRATPRMFATRPRENPTTGISTRNAMQMTGLQPYEESLRS
eukprot:7905378-Pyramimonas_sp.AAC.1